jgi:hypothetical protein
MLRCGEPVPAQRGGGDPGGAVWEDGAAREARLRGPRGGHGAPVPRVQHHGGGEHAVGDVGAGPPRD